MIRMDLHKAISKLAEFVPFGVKTFGSSGPGVSWSY